MILSPGQLYFISEQDIQTYVRSNYCKIGIVRDAVKLKLEHPAEYNECMIQGAETEALVVNPKIAQAK